ncbi:MAG: hypothetical protein R3244_06305 [Thermoanaerobaculia bacterium]|nr:hypothetical protein [Thermoanaerobaculia bacterium]
MLKKTTTLVATMLLLALPLLIAPATAEVVQKQVEGEQATLEGCLTQAATEDAAAELVEGVYVLTSTKDGTRTLLKGDEALEKHDAKHKVRVTGVWEVDRDPEITEEFDDYLVVTEIEHIAADCSAPTNPDEGTGQ